MKIRKVVVGVIAATAITITGATAFAYSDVSSGDWCNDAVSIATAHSLMSGVGNNQFSPGGTMTRAMVVQVLYNQAGRPDVSSDTKFTDVSSDAWYAKAVSWAVSNGVTSGTSLTTFSPNANVTREQFATFLYNNEGKPSVSGSLNFPDSGNVSSWAKSALLWANQNGIVNGSAENGSSYLRPQRSATRAEAAQMLSNYLTAMDKHTYGDWTVTRQSTCTTAGLKEKFCTICGTAKVTSVDALGHNYETTTTQATCTATGNKKTVCTRCGDVQSDTTIAVLGHNYKETSRTEATCSNAGKVVYTCARCGDKKTETITATGKHNYETVVTKEATCTESGSQTTKCKTCGYVESTETIDALGHSPTYVWDNGIAADCTHWNGALEVCERCGFEYNDGDKVYVWGHDFQAVGHKVYAIVTGYETGWQCNNCFQCFTDGDAINEHLDVCTKSIGNGYSNATWPIYTEVDKSNPDGQWLTIWDGHVCTKCGATSKQKMTSENEVSVN